MGYSLLLSDLDGTLLNSESRIPDANKKAVWQLLEKGVRFAICSGRSHLSIDHFVKELGLDKKGNYAIAFNGAVVYEADTLKILCEHLLECELAIAILASIKDFNAEPLLHSGDKVFFKEETETMKTYISRNKIKYSLMENIEEIDEPLSKILLIGSHEELLEIKAHTEGLFSARCNIFFSERYFLEFTNLKATKGNALEFLANHLNIGIKETIAVGDSFNDISMIEKAGLGIAVINGEEELKRAAGYVTETDNNSGVIKEIAERFFSK